MKQIQLAWTIGLAALLSLMTAAVWAVDYTYTTNADDTLTITAYTGAVGAVEIPSTIDGKTVSTIGGESFNGCTGLTSVIIPDSVTGINDGWWYTWAPSPTVVGIRPPFIGDGQIRKHDLSSIIDSD